MGRTGVVTGRLRRADYSFVTALQGVVRRQGSAPAYTSSGTTIPKWLSRCDLGHLTAGNQRNQNPPLGAGSTLNLWGKHLMSTKDSNGNGKKAKRRLFLKIGGAAGLTGAVGGTTLLSLFPRSGRTQARHHHRTPVQTNTAAQQGLAKF